MSYEIRTPLNALLGLTDLLIHENPTGKNSSNIWRTWSFPVTPLSLVNDILDLENWLPASDNPQSSFNLDSIIDSSEPSGASGLVPQLEA